MAKYRFNQPLHYRKLVSTKWVNPRQFFRQIPARHKMMVYARLVPSHFVLEISRGVGYSNIDPDDVELDCDSQLNISPLPTLWSLHELNVFARKNSGNGFLKPTNMSHKFPFGNASHLENIDSWKAGSPASNPLWLKAQSRQLFIGCSLVCSSHMSQLRAQSIACSPNLGHNHCIGRNKSWRPQLRDQTFCFSGWDRFFSVAATKGWAWSNHNAELVERTVALRNLLLVGSGCLEFQKGTAGMDVLNKHVEQISFRQCVTFCEHGQLKGWQPHFQPTVAKSSISTNFH